MKRTQISAIAIAFSTLFAGQALAADNAPITRAQVKAELAQAVNSGHTVVTESGRLAKDVFSSNYPAPQVESLTRAQVRAELAEAVANGNMVVTESGQRANEIFSSNYSQEVSVGKSREEVRQELAEAIENGLFDKHISA